LTNRKFTIFFKLNSYFFLFFLFFTKTNLFLIHKHLISISILSFGRAPHYVRVGTLRASLRSVLRTLRPSMRLTQKLSHQGKKNSKKNLPKNSPPFKGGAGVVITKKNPFIRLRGHATNPRRRAP
jgi:hypothetical protein